MLLEELFAIDVFRKLWLYHGHELRQLSFAACYWKVGCKPFLPARKNIYFSEFYNCAMKLLSRCVILHILRIETNVGRFRSSDSNRKEKECTIPLDSGNCETFVQKYRVSTLQFQKFVTTANEKTDKWKLLQNETYIFKFSSASFNARSKLQLMVPIAINFHLSAFSFAFAINF